MVANREGAWTEMHTLDPKTREMVAIAASIAGNCIPCLKYHYAEAIKLGCAKEEIQEILEIANMVKQRPVDEINKLAVQLFGVGVKEK